MFQFTPTTGLLDTATYSDTPANETAARQQFMDLFNQLRDEMNSGTSSAIGIRAMSQQAIINGNFDVWQRGTSFTNPASGAYLADRWCMRNSLDGGTLPANITHARINMINGDLPSAYYDRVTVDGSGSGFGANAFYFKQQRIEGATRLLAGAGRKVTISFYARSSIANKKLGVGLYQNYGSGGSPTANEIIPGAIINLSSTWTRYTTTITTNTLNAKTFGSNVDDYLAINFLYMWGSGVGTSNLGQATSETFVGAGTVDIAQVQVCAGDVALPFQPRSFAEELQLCQRYYERFDSNNPSGGRANLGTAVATTSTNYALPILFKTEKRVKPTLVQGGTFRFLPGGASSTITYSDGNAVSAQLSCSATGATTQQAAFVQSSDAGGWIAFDAEL